MRITPIAIAAALVLATSCNSPEEPGLDGSYQGENADSTSEPTPYDFTPQLADDTPRAVVVDGSPQLRYDNPGTLVMTTGDYAFTFVDLETAADISFSFSAISPDGSLSEPILTILSTGVEIASAVCEKSTAQGQWINILCADGRRVVIVVPRF